MTGVAKALADRRCLLFCIGAQKAGTTWLHRQLLKSDTFHATVKEFRYWNTVRAPYVRWDRMAPDPAMSHLRGLVPIIAALRSLSLQRYKKEASRQKMRFSDPLDLSGYIDFLTFGSEDRPVLGDMTPGYALCPTSTFREMAELHDNSRFIFIMRDPIDRLISGVKHRLKVSRHIGSEAKFMQTYIRAALEDRYNPDQRRSRYEVTVRNLLGAAPRDRILLLFFDRLFRQTTMDRVCDFVGLPSIRINTQIQINEGLKIANPMTEALTARAQDVFSQTYEFVDQLMDERLPHKWRIARGDAP